MTRGDKYNYLERISIEEYGLEDIRFYDKDGFMLAIGYQRVVVGERGPYVEFSDRHIRADQFYVPQDLQWKLEDPHVYYIELRSEHSNVKLYWQVNRVDYADYEIGKYYISPFDLYDIEGNALISKLNKNNILTGEVMNNKIETVREQLERAIDEIGSANNMKFSLGLFYQKGNNISFKLRGTVVDENLNSLNEDEISLASNLQNEHIQEKYNVTPEHHGMVANYYGKPYTFVGIDHVKYKYPYVFRKSNGRLVGLDKISAMSILSDVN